MFYKLNFIKTKNNKTTNKNTTKLVKSLSFSLSSTTCKIKVYKVILHIPTILRAYTFTLICLFHCLLVGKIRAEQMQLICFVLFLFSVFKEKMSFEQEAVLIKMKEMLCIWVNLSEFKLYKK